MRLDKRDMGESPPIVKCAAVVLRGDSVLLVRKRGTTDLISPGGKLERGSRMSPASAASLMRSLGSRWCRPPTLAPMMTSPSSTGTG